MKSNNSLIQAYRETEYHVFTAEPFFLVPDEFSPELLSLHEYTGVSSSAFITASNPFSQPLSNAKNTERNKHLSETLSQSGYTTIAGLGKHPSNDWPSENSVLVLNIKYKAACDIGILFSQNAILFASKDAIPKLALLA